MKIAHLILAHNHPLQLERLINKISSENSDIYIHLDKKTNFREFKYLSKINNVFFINKRISINWGGYSMLEATFKSFEEILATNKLYSHINLLSGQDYPIRNINFFENYLFENLENSYINYRSINNEWKIAGNRFTKYFLSDYKFPGSWRIELLINKILPKRKIPNNLEPYGFSQWIVITPKCVIYVLNFIKENKRIRDFFKLSFAPDETLIHTILLNSDLKNNIINDNLRYIEFDEKKLHPEILTIKDADKIMSSGKFFARKFLNTNQDILDFIDSKI